MPCLRARSKPLSNAVLPLPPGASANTGPADLRPVLRRHGLKHERPDQPPARLAARHHDFDGAQVAARWSLPATGQVSLGATVIKANARKGALGRQRET